MNRRGHGFDRAEERTGQNKQDLRASIGSGTSKSLVEPLGKANTRALTATLPGPRNTPAKTNRNLEMAIDPGTSKTLVEPLGKANTRALTTALPR